jgi:hypothetical protein
MANSQSRSLLAIAIHVASGTSLTAAAEEPAREEERVTVLRDVLRQNVPGVNRSTVVSS